MTEVNWISWISKIILFVIETFVEDYRN